MTSDTIYTSGTFKTMQFLTHAKSTPNLYLSNSYGSTLVKALRVQKYLFYEIPKNMASKRGLVTWQLLLNRKVIQQGNIQLVSKAKVAKIESYVGPPSIQAGNTDYAMDVLIPTDYLDNPIMDFQKVILKKQFLSNENNTLLTIKNLIAYDLIYATQKSGRFLLSSSCLGFQSKEQTLDVWPSLPQNFTLIASRNHDYADGNQITKIETSLLKDAYGNLVCDGTYVNFLIETKSGSILNAAGTTINGIAQTKLLHPDHQEVWTIKAFVEGMSESEPLTLNYKQTIKSFYVAFSEGNRKLKVGPFSSFMQQRIPDGLHVYLTITDSKNNTKTLAETSKGGFVNFQLNKVTFPKDSYTFTITTAEISKTFKNKKLW